MENEQERIRANVAKMQAQGASDDEIEAYLRDVEGLKSSAPQGPAVRPDATRALQRERPSASGDWQAATAPGQGKVLVNEVAPAIAAHVMNMVPIPNSVLALGGLQTGASYRESKDALESRLGEIPADLRLAEQLAGAPSIPQAVRNGVKYLPAAWAGAKELSKDVPILRRLGRASRAAKAVRKALPETKVTPIRGKATIADEAVPASLEERLGLTPESLGLTDAAPEAATIEQRIGDVVKNSANPTRRGAKNARFEWFAERQAAQRGQDAVEAAKPVTAQSAEPTLEDLLGLSLEHTKKGGTMDQLIRVNPRRPR